MPRVRTGDFDCFYEDDDFTDPWRESETLLIQHGFGRNSRYWNRWVPHLAGHYRVIRRDMRAHGGSSDSGPDYVWSVEGLVEDLVAFLDALGLERVHYVGESVGGPTGIALAVAHPERLASLTLVSGVLRLSGPVQKVLGAGYPDFAAAIRELGPGGYVSRGPEPADPVARAERAWDRAEWDRAHGYALEGLARLTPHVDVEPLLPDVRVPTLILAPAESPMTPLRDQVTMREKIPDARIEVIEGHGHNFYPAEAELCTESVWRFIESLAGGSPRAAP
jgi:pimeloyl-ACP methyl ester carboxylesterase